MSDDIVARLRDCDGGYGFRGIVREAADLIERLRAEIDRLSEGQRILNRNLLVERKECAACAIDRKRTQRERDEARREICILRASSTNATEKVSAEMAEYARSRGWESLEEVKP